MTDTCEIIYTANIPGFPGYVACENGDIYSSKNGDWEQKTINVGKKGYCTVGLTAEGSTVQKRYRHHIIIAKAWIPNPNNLPTVNHKNKNRSDNRVENLEWSTQRKQNTHARETGTYKKPNKPVCQADLEGNIIAEFESIKAAAEATGSSANGIGAVCKKRQSTCNGFVWFYKSDQKKQVRGHSNAKIVLQYTLDGIFIKEHASCRAAAEAVNSNPLSISMACRGLYKTAAKFKWAYKVKEKTDLELLQEEVKDWVELEDYPLYKISNDGRIYSCRFKIIMKQTWCGDGYSVGITVNKVSRNMYVHRLVGLAYIPNPNKFPVVNHKDGNERNNIVSNLEWCTKKQNSQHAADTGLLSVLVPVIQMSLDGEYIAKYDSMTAAGKALGFNGRNISAVINGKNKTANGFLWKIANEEEELEGNEETEIVEEEIEREEVEIVYIEDPIFTYVAEIVYLDE